MSQASADPRLIAPRSAPKRRVRVSWSDPVFRAVVWQVVIVGLVAAAVWYLIRNTSENLAARHIATGFGFLGRVAGIPIGESVISYNPAIDTYGRALLIGVLNTLKVSVIGVVLATILGTLIGIGRLSRNWLLSKLTAFYVETLRDIPLLLQLLFWYTVLQGLPSPKQAWHLGSFAFLTNRGMKVPLLQWQPAHSFALLALAIGIVLTTLWNRHARHRQEATGIRPAVWPVAIVCIVGLPTLVWAALGAPFQLDLPVLHGFNFQGGATLSPEYFALMLGLVIYTASYIAEIVRAGIQAIPQGQWEAAGALGLHPGLVLRKIVPAAGDARDHPAADQPVPEPDQEQLAGHRHRLPGHRLRRQHHPEPDRPGDRGHRHHHGGLPDHQPVDQPVHELVQRASRTGGALGT